MTWSNYFKMLLIGNTCASNVSLLSMMCVPVFIYYYFVVNVNLVVNLRRLSAPYSPAHINQEGASLVLSLARVPMVPTSRTFVSSVFDLGSVSLTMESSKDQEAGRHASSLQGRVYDCQY